MSDVGCVAPPRTRLPDEEIAELAAEFETRPPQDLVGWSLARFGDRVALASSLQAESIVLLDMAWRIDPHVRVFTIDTGRLPQETYDLIDRVRDRYGLAMEVVFPDAADIARLTTERGVNLFYRSVEGRLLCCEARKSEPLRRKLAECDAWVTGLRREHAATRRGIGKVEADPGHDGICKCNPLADWTTEQVWAYIRANAVPYHALYDQGYTSISCACCTRATRPGEDPRAGRWWWERDAPKECGMHCAIG